jgi:iron complex transport system substrate-binding protein
VIHQALRAWPALGAAVAVVAALATPAATAAPAAAAAAAGRATEQVSLPAPAPAPQRIVSLLPSLTETVCALGACDRLVGVDRHANWPAEVQRLPRLGGLDELQVERLVALKPDLVLVAESQRAVQRLRALGLRVEVLEPRSLADARVVTQRLASLLGEPARAEALWRTIDARLAEQAAAVPAAWRGRRVYFEVAANPYAASEASFIGELLQRLGLRNVVGREWGPFPQLSPEWVVKQAPELLMGTREAVAGMPRRPGWSSLEALSRGQVCGFAPADFDTLMRPGPRLPEAAAAVVSCLQALAAPAG